MKQGYKSSIYRKSGVILGLSDEKKQILGYNMAIIEGAIQMIRKRKFDICFMLLQNYKNFRIPQTKLCLNNSNLLVLYNRCKGCDIWTEYAKCNLEIYCDYFIKNHQIKYYAFGGAFMNEKERQATEQEIKKEITLRNDIYDILLYIRYLLAKIANKTDNNISFVEIRTKFV